jgi:hypothetical protein
MAFIAGGIVSLKPIGGIVTNHPGMSDTQIQAAQQAVAQKAQDRQQKVDNFITKVAASNVDSKKWSVPFK